ncbi:MAG: hypothetical protein AB7O67_07485 [Vicinamibacterales bacterium]
MHSRARPASFVGAVMAIALAAAGCGDLFPATDPPPAPVQPGVSARHAFPSGGGVFNGLSVRARGYDVTVSWRAGGAARGVASTDAGATFAALPPALLAGGPAEEAGLRVMPAGDDWQVAGTGELRAHEPVTVGLPGVLDGTVPVAFDEYCGLLSVVATETRGEGGRMAIHRFLTPRRGGRGALVGTPVNVADIAAPPGDVVVAAVPDAAVVAWTEGERLRVVRVELPGVACTPFG